MQQDTAGQNQSGKVFSLPQMFQQQACSIGQGCQQNFHRRRQPTAATQKQQTDAQHDFPFPAVWCQVKEQHGNGQKQKYQCK